MSNFNRAILLTSPRSGSEMLIYALNTHPLIRAESELIGDYIRRHGDVPKLPLLQMFYDEQRLLKDDRTYMFKAMYDDLDRACWNWIKENNIKVIHLVRDDQLRRVVSHEFMRRMKEIGRKSAKAFEKIPAAQLEVDVNWILNNLRENIKEVELHREKIKSLPFIEVHYTEMVSEEGKEIEELPEALVVKIIKFLGIDYPQLKTALKKQNPKNLKEMIINYEKLIFELKKNGLDKYICE